MSVGYEVAKQICDFMLKHGHMSVELTELEHGDHAGYYIKEYVFPKKNPKRVKVPVKYDGKRVVLVIDMRVFQKTVEEGGIPSGMKN